MISQNGRHVRQDDDRLSCVRQKDHRAAVVRQCAPVPKRGETGRGPGSQTHGVFEAAGLRDAPVHGLGRGLRNETDISEPAVLQVRRE